MKKYGTSIGNELSKHHKDGYKCEHEARIAAKNPYLEYEAFVFPYVSLTLPGKISPTQVKKMNDGYYIPASMFEIRKQIYSVDWVIPASMSATGKPIYIESKSGNAVKIDDLMKVGAVMAEHPDADIRFLLSNSQMKPGRLMPTGYVKPYKSKGLIVDWLKTAGIQYAIGDVVPREWIK